jgi:hypothetical protein
MRAVRMGREAAETVGAAYNLRCTAYKAHRTTHHTLSMPWGLRPREEVRAAAGEG